MSDETVRLLLDPSQRDSALDELRLAIEVLRSGDDEAPFDGQLSRPSAIAALEAMTEAIGATPRSHRLPLDGPLLVVQSIVLSATGLALNRAETATERLLERESNGDFEPLVIALDAARLWAATAIELAEAARCE